MLNKDAWTDPAAGQWGTSAAYYNDYRNRRVPRENLSFGRLFRITERASLNLRAEFTNVFNRTVFPAVTSNIATANQTRIVNSDVNSATTGGFGWLNTTAVAANVTRQGQIVARFRF